MAFARLASVCLNDRESDVRVRAPELPQQTWLNSDRALSLQQLRGKVVILDFWTYCCINCLHILPDLKYLEQKYKARLAIVGVHSAKFDNEQEVDNIRQAILRYDIDHPVLVDRDFNVWQQYTVRAWPTLVVVDPEGYVVGSVAGEGNRAALDKIVEQLIQEHQNKATIAAPELELFLEKQARPLTTPLAFPGKVLATKARLFTSDSSHHRVVVSTLEGEVLHLLGSGKPGLTDGSFSDTQFSHPQGMAFDPEKQFLYVADTNNHAIRRVDLEHQIVTTIAGTGEQSQNVRSSGGSALKTALNSPWDLTKVGDSLFIAMAGSHQIWRLQLATSEITVYAGMGAEACLDGSLSQAAFAQPSGIASNGNKLYIADSEASSIRSIDLTSHVNTVCGSGDLFDFGDVDGVGAEVRLQHNLGVDYFQNRLWVADTYNHKIKCIDPHTRGCQTVLGTGKKGYLDGNAAIAEFSEPSGISGIDSFIYIADTNNHAIRRVDLNTLKVTTIKFYGLCAPNFCFPD